MAAGETLHCTCSIGIATFPEDGESWDRLFEAADAALYSAKRGGRNQVRSAPAGNAHNAA